MKLVQAKEWLEAYKASHYELPSDIDDLLIDAFLHGWREGWEDGELCGYNRGREHNENGCK